MGTAYGEQRWSPVAYTSFVRARRRANAVLGIRYNSYNALVTAGIISYPTAPYVPTPCVGYCYQPGFAPPPPPMRNGY